MPTTKVVNLRVEHYDQYIGRAGKGQIGYFGNSHQIGFCSICNKSHTRDECIAAFKEDFLKRIKEDPEFKAAVEELRGKSLGCFCKPQKCHGDIYVDYLEGKL